MQVHFKFPVIDGEIPFGNAGNICFGCGVPTDLKKELFFENLNGFGLLGRIKSLLDRKTITIPLCKDCQEIVPICRKKILHWSIITFAAMAIGIGAIVGFDLKFDQAWHFLVMFGPPIYPMHKIKQYWQLKDQGGMLIDIGEADEKSITIVFNNALAGYAVARTISDQIKEMKANAADENP